MARKKQRMLKTLALRPELPDEVEKQAIITASPLARPSLTAF
jgi:hypothetical protein